MNERDDRERRADEEVGRLWQRLPIPTDEELRAAASTAATYAQEAGPADRQPARSPRRWAFVVVSVALLAASGLGFGLGSSLTASGQAGPSVVGFGFIPVREWSVMQTGALDANGLAEAVAANVRIHPADASGRPEATLRALPRRGAVLWTTFLPRGDESVDGRFPARSLPLQVAEATPVAPIKDRSTPARVVQYRLTAAVGGYNVETRIFFGSQPSGDELAAAQRQLSGLVVASNGITLVVQPRVVRDFRQRLSIFGSVDSGNGGEKVRVQFKACGANPSEFRDTHETTTRAGGGFSFSQLQPFGPGISGTFRAVSGSSVSSDVPVQYQADVFLRYPRRGRFEAGVLGLVSLWRRQVLLQRYERARGIWITVRRLVLTEQEGGGIPNPGIPDLPQPVVFATEPFRAGVPKGTLIRVVFPLAQARPCYLAGVSEVRRA
jgi:hypothetical protein